MLLTLKMFEEIPTCSLPLPIDFLLKEDFLLFTSPSLVGTKVLNCLSEIQLLSSYEKN